MRLTAETRQRVLSAARHAAIAAGVGVGWLLLSGQSASADSHTSPQLPAVSGVVSSVQTIAQPLPSVIQDASAALPKVSAVPKSVSEVQGALSGGITQTTTALASSVEALPSAVAPVLSGPLEPLAPVVDRTASGLGSALTEVGGGVATTVETPVPGSVPEVLHGLEAPAAAPTTAEVASPGPEDSPAADNPVAPADASSDALGAAPSSIAPVGLDWSQIWSQTADTTADGFAADSPASPANGQDQQHQLPPPSAPPGSSTGGSDGTVGGGPNAASLAGGFLLALSLFLSGRRHPLSALVPPTPAFDPGSTPD